MDEAGRRAARRRAVIAFIVAGALVLVSLAGLMSIDRRQDRFGRIRDRVEKRADQRFDRRIEQRRDRWDDRMHAGGDSDNFDPPAGSGDLPRWGGESGDSDGNDGDVRGDDRGQRPDRPGGDRSTSTTTTEPASAGT